jgi:hypothetical protein
MKILSFWAMLATLSASMTGCETKSLQMQTPSGTPMTYSTSRFFLGASTDLEATDAKGGSVKLKTTSDPKGDQVSKIVDSAVSAGVRAAASSAVP